jgi:AcrR family transcriptional regulator
MSKRGYKGTSLDEMAKHVGIHKSSLFHYFKNKEQILLQVLAKPTEVVVTAIRQIVESKDLTPEEKLYKAIQTHLSYQVLHTEIINVYNSEFRFLAAPYRRQHIKQRDLYAECFVRIVREIQEKGGPTFRNFKDLDSKVVAFAILGMCNSTLRWFKRSGPLSTDDVADAYFKLLACS